MDFGHGHRAWARQLVLNMPVGLLVDRPPRRLYQPSKTNVVTLTRSDCLRRSETAFYYFRQGEADAKLVPRVSTV